MFLQSSFVFRCLLIQLFVSYLFIFELLFIHLSAVNL
nr:MAG TPA: hypothetical protein [Caudoviricetes sp.]